MSWRRMRYLILIIFLIGCVKQEEKNTKLDDIDKLNKEIEHINCISTVLHVLQIVKPYIQNKIKKDEFDDLFNFCDKNFGSKD